MKRLPSLLFFRRCCLLLFGITCILTASAQAQAPADTLRLGAVGAIQRALEISPEVGIEAAERDFAQARFGLARASRFLTDIEFTSAHAPGPGLKNTGDTPTGELYLNPEVRNDWDDLSPFTRMEVEMLQPIYTWGELGGNIAAARHGVALEAAAVEAKEAEVAFRTGELYYNVLLADALFRLANEAGDVVGQARDQIQELLDEGAEDVDDADLFQVLITEQQFNRRVVEVTQLRQTAYVALARQLFLPEGTVVVTEDATLASLEFTPAPLESYFEIALINRPEMAQADAGLAAREALIRVARSDYFPKIFFGASATVSALEGRFRQRNPFVSDPFLSRGIQAGIGTRLKLNVLQTRARVAQARAEYEEVRYQSQAARQLILFEVEEAYRNLLVAKAALDAQQEAERISRRWLRTEQINFDLDLGDTDNLIKAVQANLELQASTHEAVQKYNVAVLRLMRVTGVLVRQAKSGILVDTTGGGP